MALPCFWARTVSALLLGLLCAQAEAEVGAGKGHLQPTVPHPLQWGLVRFVLRVWAMCVLEEGCGSIGREGQGWKPWWRANSGCIGSCNCNLISYWEWADHYHPGRWKRSSNKGSFVWAWGLLIYSAYWACGGYNMLSNKMGLPFQNKTQNDNLLLCKIELISTTDS